MTYDFAAMARELNERCVTHPPTDEAVADLAALVRSAHLNSANREAQKGADAA